MRLPESIAQLTGGREYIADEVGMSGAQIFCFSDRVLKIERRGAESDREREMLFWLQDKLPVPRILAAESKEGFNYLLMSRAEGEMACAPAFLAQPDQLVQLLAQALQMLWQVDTASCPEAPQGTLAGKLRFARERIEQGLCNMEDADPETYGRGGFSSPQALLRWLEENRPPEETVFSHGDFCLPNLFLCPKRVSGFIDWGRSGVLDRYQDIALCYRSLRDNFSGQHGGREVPGFHPEQLFELLGLRPDWEKVRYYILLDELF